MLKAYRLSMLKVEEDKSGLKFNIFVQPKSSWNQVVGLHGNALKVKIKATPVEGLPTRCASPFWQSF